MDFLFIRTSHSRGLFLRNHGAGETDTVAVHSPYLIPFTIPQKLQNIILLFAQSDVNAYETPESPT
jgi:hypothetical protein